MGYHVLKTKKCSAKCVIFFPLIAGRITLESSGLLPSTHVFRLVLQPPQCGSPELRCPLGPHEHDRGDVIHASDIPEPAEGLFWIIDVEIAPAGA